MTLLQDDEANQTVAGLPPFDYYGAPVGHCDTCGTDYVHLLWSLTMCKLPDGRLRTMCREHLAGEQIRGTRPRIGYRQLRKPTGKQVTTFLRAPHPGVAVGPRPTEQKRPGYRMPGQPATTTPPPATGEGIPDDVISAALDLPDPWAPATVKTSTPNFLSSFFSGLLRRGAQ